MSKMFYKRGFTLIELLIALGITTILGGIGTASYFNYQTIQVIDSAANELSGTLRDAYQRAVSQDNSSAWGVYVVNTPDETNDYYELFYGDSYATGTVLVRYNLANGLEFLVPTEGTSKEILFAKSTGLTSVDHTITIASKQDPTLFKTTQISESSGFITSYSGLSPAPVVSSIGPDYVLNIEPANIADLSGANFQTNATVKLTKSGKTDINCTDVTVVSSTRLTLICDVTAAPVGAWNVVVTNPDNQSGMLAGSFIISAKGGNVSGYAWSEDDGWISFSCSNDMSCNSVEYGVDIDPITGLFSGYAWSDNIGWISFNQSDLTGCPSGTCEARVTGGFIGTFPKTVTGWGKALVLADEVGGGWISLSTTTDPLYGVSLAADGKFSGYAWESDLIGWISFNGTDPLYNVSAEW
ncbi:MAG: pilus assembly FimT family protein [Minisyncoccota bacterium]